MIDAPLPRRAASVSLSGVTPMGTALAGPLQRKVLVVEDNELNRRLLEVRLEIHGYEALTTSMGAAALDIAREQQPDLILMDIQLPDISGTEAIRRLKADEQTRDIPIIVVTGREAKRELAVEYRDDDQQPDIHDRGREDDPGLCLPQHTGLDPHAAGQDHGCDRGRIN